MPGYDATSVNVHLRTSEETGEVRAGVSGIYRCGSPWLCPTCSVYKAHERAERVQAAAKATFQRGGRAALVVLTASHSLNMSLSEIKALVASSSSTARKGRAWMTAVKEYGILGVVVGQEVTYSTENGWHYHQHLSVLVDGPDGEDAEFYKYAGAYERAKAAGAWIARAYTAQVRARGGTVSNRHGWHVRIAESAVDASNYTAKGSMAWEISGGHKDETKTATSITPWNIAIAAANGDKTMFAKWREYMEIMPGTRSCVVSASLARKLGLTLADDGEGGGELHHEADSLVGRVAAPTWRKWMRHGLAATFLSRVEAFQWRDGDEEEFDAAVEATERDAEPLEAEYQRLRAERAALQKIEIERRAIAIEAEREARRIDSDTAFARAYAIDRLRRFSDRHGALGRLGRIVAEAAAVFPSSRPLDPADLLRAAA